MPLPRLHRNSGCLSARSALFSIPLALLVGLGLSGCSRLRPQPKTEIVYVLAKETFLRDRVAAVSNRVAMVQNGQRLELLEHDRRFLKVKTEDGKVGWIEEHSVVNPDVVSGFEQLKKSQAKDPVVATAVLRDDGYLHLKPGRDTERYYLLPENEKLQLLLRASVPKVVGPQASPSTSSFASAPSGIAAKKSLAKANAAQEKAAQKAAKEKADAKAAPAVTFKPAPPPPPSDSMTSPEPAESEAAPPPPAAPPAPVPMEDWWLVRDTKGRLGWMMARRLDVDVPDDIAGYAEGQKMVAAYLLRKVYDPDSNFPDKLAPEYVTVLNPYQDGLPYDFNQVRVFTWNARKHRYETAYRQRNLQGYLPVVVAAGAEGKGAPSPTFQIAQGVGDSITLDPDTGVARPTSTQVSTYVLEEDRVRKVGPETPAARSAAPSATQTGRRASKKKAAKAQRRRSK